MSGTVDALIFDLLEFVAREEQPYSEVLETWRTSCPKLPVWEDANERGFISRVRVNGHAVVRLTDAGAAFLQRHKSNYRRA